MDIVANKETFKNYVNRFIHRDGIEKLLNWLDRTDFFVAPASTQYNLCVEGGLCQHCLNVFSLLTRKYFGKTPDGLTPYDERFMFDNELTLESIAIVSLLAYVHKTNCYVKDFKNVKVNNQWEKQEYWKWEEQFIYAGRGSKSVYIIQQYIKLFVEEAQAIAFIYAAEDSMFSGTADGTYKKVYEESPLAVYLHLAEMEATYILDKADLE